MANETNWPVCRTIGDRQFVIGDGAMATYLHQFGVPIRVCAEELNISSPRLVEQVHAAYVAAGSTVIQTNTFAANRSSLERYELESEMARINQAAVDLARRAAGDKASVYATMGPVEGGIHYGGTLIAEERQALADMYREQAKALADAGVDGWIVETFPDLEEMLLVLDVVRGLSDKPVVANLSPEEVGVTRDGYGLGEAFLKMQNAGATVTGLNCRLGPYGILRSYERLTIGQDKFAAYPNAGILQLEENDGLSYTGDEKSFASVMADVAQLGVTWLGGCCGTSPNYIRALVNRLEQADFSANRVEDLRSHARVAPTSRVTQIDADAATYGGIRPEVPSVADMVRESTTVIVELDPPKSLDVDRFIQGARALRAAGADMITMADNSLGMVRMSNMALASLLKQFGIEPLVHVTCRDRNLIGQQSHLMGLHALGIRNILLITGDPSRYGDLPGASSVFDVSSMNLTKMVKKLNEGIGFSGKSLRSPSEFVMGTAFNPHVRNFDKAIERLKRKVAAGADYVMTQPVYEPGLMEKIAFATEDLGVPVFIGVMPLTSLRNAEFIHHQVPGIDIPEDVMRKMESVSVEDAPTVGYEIAESLCDKALEYFRGIYLITPFLKYDWTVRLTGHIRECSRT